MTPTTLTYFTQSYIDRDIRCIYNGEIKNTIESLYQSFRTCLPENIKVAIVKNKIVISDKYNEKIATVTFRK
jgi:hypothetical protein